MSNLLSARDAIKAEIAHVTKGRDHYQMQLEMLEKALAALEGVNAASPGKTAPNKRAAKTQTGQRRQGVKAVGSRAIPSTGGDFWTKLITDQPQSAPDILKAAIAQLGMTPSQDLNAKLSARMTNALTQLVKSKQIKDSGARRERRFFK
ncbi:hypothetical protein ACFQAT_08620 [Undibacterium arcticum]|uniref:Uncharacterized protein n=1 Tax=Undibacterium arcticum TaxID=1762892 RepID=A0ABV7F5X1_9BURK